jgi:hypothetical protein
MRLGIIAWQRNWVKLARLLTTTHSQTIFPKPQRLENDKYHLIRNAIVLAGGMLLSCCSTLSIWHLLSTRFSRCE